MPDQTPQEPEWFKKFKEVNTKGAAPAERQRPPSTRITPPGGGGDEERRRHHRFDLNDTTLTLYREGLLTLIGMGKENKAKVAVNLSEGGIQVISRERLNVGAKVKIRLEIAKFKDAIEAVGVVRWCYQNAQRKDDFHVGLQFENLPGTEQRKIASMREWFTSPAFRAVRETRLRKKGEDEPTVFPK
ncbi:MAG TPA: PilZ domain-containing protein [Planctomycetota bacterium]